MDPTQIKSGVRTSSLPVPADSSDAEPYQRAPTLMAGATAGGQGEVRVWAGSPRAARQAALILLVPTAVLVVGWRHFYGGELLFLVWWFLVLRAWLWPSYITTDEQGIAFTTWRGSRALRWGEIEALELAPSLLVYGCRLLIHAPRRLSIDMNAHSRARTDELKELIACRAGLCPLSSDARRYRRVDPLPPGQG